MAESTPGMARGGGDEAADASTDPKPVELTPAVQAWEGGIKAMTSGDPGGLSRYDENAAEPWYHTIRVQHDEAFFIQPIMLGEGRFKDCRIFLLRPYTKVFRFLDLPPEIRTMVYDLMLPNATSTISMSTYKPHHKPRRPCCTTFLDKRLHAPLEWDPTIGKWIDQPLSTAASLFRVNKLIHKEMTSIWYSTYTLEFFMLKEMRVFLETIGTMRQYLRSVGVTYGQRYDSRMRRVVFALLEGAQNLRTIYLPHAMICGTGTLASSVGSLMVDSRSLLETIHAAQRAGREGADPLSLFKVEYRYQMCAECVSTPPRPTQCAMGISRACKIPCLDNEAHCLALTARIRSEVAKVLGVRI
ncbi:hypothetical protein LTR91_001866 [Friedmanniomyces endolithicus]|uniref:Uncharacterized protein n=1 Tax=Friedmanniomyces endolithicus TaxID=329885 RepID=A0AAN6KZU3_9PEZI|nr:hypothetical protein LTR94_000753 [Friedmanniomyces endolithicus]KAK0815391.1 hypothetical protein LTR59_000464 [Friedmanniomyces endolithicus]KAK0817233.1 hypothetical protein LTR75_003213 [Friedmanniomyces endolithicus]KAK0818179.1 hypothetical protein LTR38_001226 [Friedmanniomyces endolithicus]KAK0856714.1 hypothetical protein LTR03_001051 [Friedmanniomyces endolithicus]